MRFSPAFVVASVAMASVTYGIGRYAGLKGQPVGMSADKFCHLSSWKWKSSFVDYDFHKNLYFGSGKATNVDLHFRRAKWIDAVVVLRMR
jgi:hypothetical protein